MFLFKNFNVKCSDVNDLNFIKCDNRSYLKKHRTSLSEFSSNPVKGHNTKS